MVPEKKETTGIASMNSCPNCYGVLIRDDEKGEILCPKCGFVVIDQGIDSDPEWKHMDYEDRLKHMRVGSPTTFSLHDYGLSTEIATENRDSHGRHLDQYTRQNAQRMQKWQRRIRTSATGQRSLSIALGKISEASSTLTLPSQVAEEASFIYRKSAKQNISKSKSVAGMAAASIYLACRRRNINRNLKEIAEATGIQERVAGKYFRLLINELEKTFVPPLSIQKYISKLANKEKVNAKIERLALDIAIRANETEISSGKTPSGLAGAYIYIASVLSAEHIPSKEIADSAEVTEMTVRNRCREILEKFTIRQKLRPSFSV